MYMSTCAACSAYVLGCMRGVQRIHTWLYARHAAYIVSLAVCAACSAYRRTSFTRSVGRLYALHAAHTGSFDRVQIHHIERDVVVVHGLTCAICRENSDLATALLSPY